MSARVAPTMLAGALTLLGGLGVGCASADAGAFAARFVTNGAPAIDLGGPVPAPAPPARSGPTQQPRFVARSSAGLVTLEATSPRLREDLAALGAAPSVAGYLAVAATYRAHGVDDRAFDYLAEGVAHYPRAAALHDATARMWRDWGLPDRALRHAHLAVRYAPESPATHNTLGTVLWALSDFRNAAHAFAAAVARDPAAGYARQNVCLAAAALALPGPVACPAAAPGARMPPPS